jgi:hypothetical protein
MKPADRWTDMTAMYIMHFVQILHKIKCVLLVLNICTDNAAILYIIIIVVVVVVIIIIIIKTAYGQHIWGVPAWILSRVTGLPLILVISHGVSLCMPGQYIETGHRDLLPNPYPLTVHDHFPIIRCCINLYS